jgi:hypothetical protein
MTTANLTGVAPLVGLLRRRAVVKPNLLLRTVLNQPLEKLKTAHCALGAAAAQHCADSSTQGVASDAAKAFAALA